MGDVARAVGPMASGFGHSHGRAALLLVALSMCGVVYGAVGGACKGGEQKAYKDQPAASTVSSGKCMKGAKLLCEDTYSKSSNGATGCESDPADTLCCSKTLCKDGGQEMRKSIGARSDQGSPHEKHPESKEGV